MRILYITLTASDPMIWTATATTGTPARTATRLAARLLEHLRQTERAHHAETLARKYGVHLSN